MTRQNFRKMLVLDWLLLIAAVIVSFTTESLLPAELRSYLEARRNAPMTGGDIVFAAVGLGLLIFAVVLSVGLFRFRRWAKQLLPPSYVIGLTLLPALGAHVETGWATLMFYLCSLADGVILAVVYFSPLKEEFEMDRDA
jgi:hypothetical protein